MAEIKHSPNLINFIHSCLRLASSNFSRDTGNTLTLKSRSFVLIIKNVGGKKSPVRKSKIHNGSG